LSSSVNPFTPLNPLLSAAYCAADETHARDDVVRL
jgi:hypothetical protein